jgi:hypothetical protein
VQYTFKCMPRLWCNNVMLWEPLGKVEVEGGCDEWMYELRNIEDGGEAFGPAVLQRLLLSLRDGTPPEAVSKKAKMLKVEFSDQLTPSDRATLDYVLHTLESACEISV